MVIKVSITPRYSEGGRGCTNFVENGDVKDFFLEGRLDGKGVVNFYKFYFTALI